MGKAKWTKYTQSSRAASALAVELRRWEWDVRAQVCHGCRTRFIAVVLGPFEVYSARIRRSIIDNKSLFVLALFRSSAAGASAVAEWLMGLTYLLPGDDVWWSCRFVNGDLCFCRSDPPASSDAGAVSSVPPSPLLRCSPINSSGSTLSFLIGECTIS